MNLPRFLKQFRPNRTRKMKNAIESQHPFPLGGLNFASAGAFENGCDLVGVSGEALRHAADPQRKLAGQCNVRQPSPRNIEPCFVLRCGRGLLACSALNRDLIARGGAKARWLRHGPHDEFNIMQPVESRKDYKRFVALTNELPLGLELACWQRDAAGWEVCSGLADELPPFLLRRWADERAAVRVFAHRDPPPEKWLHQLGESGIAFDVTEIEGAHAPPRHQGKLLLWAPPKSALTAR